MRKIRVLVADDDADTREAICILVGAEADIEIVGEAVDGRDVVGRTTTTYPDVVLMDLRMPGVDGLSATEVLHRTYPSTQVLVLTTFATRKNALDAIRAGAAGFASKTDPPDMLAEAVRRVASGDSAVSPRVLRELLDDFRRSGTIPDAPVPLQGLTEKEVEVLRLVGKGGDNAEISRQLNISVNTTRTHIAHLRMKLAVNSRAALAAKAWQHHLCMQLS